MQIKQDLTVPSIAGTWRAMNKRIIPNAGNFIADFYLEVQNSKKIIKKLQCFVLYCDVDSFSFYFFDILGEKESGAGVL